MRIGAHLFGPHKFRKLRLFIHFLRLRISSRPRRTHLLKLEVVADPSNSLTMLQRKKETEGNTELDLQSPQRSKERQLQDSKGGAEFNLMLARRRTPRQSQEIRGSTEFNLVSPQRSQKKLLSPLRSSYSSPRTKNEHAHPRLFCLNHNVSTTCLDSQYRKSRRVAY
jgi:hypothetical protein